MEVDHEVWNMSHLKSILKIADRNKVLFLLKFQSSAKLHFCPWNLA